MTEQWERVEMNDGDGPTELSKKKARINRNQNRISWISLLTTVEPED